MLFMYYFRFNNHKNKNNRAINTFFSIYLMKLELKN